MTMRHHIPNEILMHILTYVPNIYIRQSFGIFHKLKEENYSILHSCMRQSPRYLNRDRNNIMRTRYYFAKNIDIPCTESHLNDFIDVIISNDLLELSIWKLKKSPDDYYWKLKQIKHAL